MNSEYQTPPPIQTLIDLCKQNLTLVVKGWGRKAKLERCGSWGAISSNFGKFKGEHINSIVI